MTHRQILHIDMDAFYASVEVRDDPTLRGRPLAVGGHSRRGVVLAASYEARPFGVHSAMPMMEALRRCPHLTVVPPHRERYEEVSGHVFAIFRRFTPLVEGLSLDEAFLDVTRSHALFGDGVAIARAIKQTIRSETGLTASAGVAPCKFAAKIASDLEKPDGLVVVPPDAIAEFLAPLAVERMWGVGPKTAPKMRAAGYATLGDLARAESASLEALLGSWGREVNRLAQGIDDRNVDPTGLAKSISAEQTYERDLLDRAAIERTLLEHAGRVAQRLVRERLFCRTVVVKLKFADFTLRTRRTTLPEPVADATSIYDAAAKLLDRLELRRARVRLTGVGVSGLSESEADPTLFPDRAAQRRRAIEQTIADVADRYGGAGITRATLIDAPEQAVASASLYRPRARRGVDS